MGDDRVNEQREALRLEQQRRAEKAAEQKRLGEAGEFKRVVTALQKNNATADKAQAQAQARRQGVASKQLARAGVRSGAAGRALGKAGDERNLGKRQDRDSEGGRQAAQRATAQRQKGLGVHQGAVQKVGARNQGGGGGGGGRRPGADSKKGPQKGGGGPDRHNQLLAAHAGIQTVSAMAGIQARSSGGALGARPSADRLVAMLVKGVRQGMSTKGLGLIQVDLKDEVLGGARLQINSMGHGVVGLQVQVERDDVAQLFADRDNATSLRQALTAAGIELKSLEVNGRPV